MNTDRQPACGTGSSREDELKKAKRVAPEESWEERTKTKRQRRVFSCESCQRLKCKCDYDPGIISCRRCHTLRIQCSLRNTVNAPVEPEVDIVNFNVLERRLHQTERTLDELKSLIKTLSQQVERSGNQTVVPKDEPKTGPSRPGVAQGHGASEEPETGCLPSSVDGCPRSAPLSFLREIGRHYVGTYTRPREFVDLVTSQLLGDEIAGDLIQMFLGCPGHGAMVRQITNASSSDNLRAASPFLHSVCCLFAIAFRKDLFGTNLHRQVYEHVRFSLTQTLLANSPTLEDILGVLLMSDCLVAGTGDGAEYIESWMMTGYSATQAIFSLNFSEILRDTRKDKYTPENGNAVRLWSKICLHHLHWAATTGRPSVIPDSYLNHCDMLLSFYDASFQDSIVLAEIFLYKILLEALQARSYLNNDGDCVKLADWKQQWSQHIASPMGSMLKIGFYSACLILIVRSLESLGECLSPTNFLSKSSACDGSTPFVRGALDLGKDKEEDRRSGLRRNASTNARCIINTYIRMPAVLKDSITSNKCLFLGYSALILVHYEEYQSQLSDRDNLRLINELEECLAKVPGKLVVAKFVRVAKQKLIARLNRGRSDQPTAQQEGQRQDCQKIPRVEDGIECLNGLFTSVQHSETSKFSPGGEVTSITEHLTEQLPAGTPIPPNAESLIELSDSFPNFPNIESLFGGGFLDLTSLEE